MNKCICTLAFACFALLTQTGCHINYESYKDKWPTAPGTTNTSCPEKLVCETQQDGTQICEKRNVCDTTNCQQDDPCYKRNDNSNNNTGSNNTGTASTNHPPTTNTTDAGEPCPTDP